MGASVCPLSMAPGALWLWGQCAAFERYGIALRFQRKGLGVGACVRVSPILGQVPGLDGAAEHGDDSIAIRDISETQFVSQPPMILAAEVGATRSAMRDAP